MNPDHSPQPDKFQQAWQAAASSTRVTIATDLLRTEVERNQHAFQSVINARDFVEIFVSLAMVPVFLVMGYFMALPWTWYLTIPSMLFVAAFMYFFRARHQQPPSQPGEPLLRCVERSLIEVDDQIWLLRNVFWWYLLPPSLSISAFFLHTSWKFAVTTDQWLAGAAFGALLLGFLFVVYYWVYWVNQRAVKNQLEPRRQELLTLLASLGDESTGEVVGEYPILRSTTTGLERISCCSLRRSIVIAFAGVAMLAVGVFAILYFAKHSGEVIEAVDGSEYPKLAPYAAIRWEGERPVIQLDGEWFRLYAINTTTTDDIVAFSKKNYGDLWQKRFEEDLVELLTRMGRPPKDTVWLMIQTLDFPLDSRYVKDIPMTRANRDAIRDAAEAREPQPK
jgi:hypothetical protein